MSLNSRKEDLKKKIDTLSLEELRDVMRFVEFLHASEEKRKSLAAREYVSVLLGAVSFFERISCSMGDADAKLYREIYCDPLRIAMQIIRSNADGTELDESVDYEKIRYIIQCLTRFHKLTYYGIGCDHVCSLEADLDGVPCEICENRKCPKEEIENDLYLKALTHVLKVMNVRGV